MKKIIFILVIIILISVSGCKYIKGHDPVGESCDEDSVCKLIKPFFIFRTFGGLPPDHRVCIDNTCVKVRYYLFCNVDDDCINVERKCVSKRGEALARSAGSTVRESPGQQLLSAEQFPLPVYRAQWSDHRGIWTPAFSPGFSCHGPAHGSGIQYRRHPGGGVVHHPCHEGRA